ncbi:MAG: pentapeptide repeat-containing protein [Scytonematopsis contorta HA4267-MV1]|jgi:uncharacterized protein YjbI with pentapeptide repeats|nr:pentapeptide repeat-containing protein [Scytonematopsis contorta HA4267-MV1]
MNINIRHWLGEKNIEITDLQGLSPGQIAGIAFRIVEDMEVKSLNIIDICTFVEVLEQPIVVASVEISLIAELTESLLRYLSQKKPLKRNEGTWLAFQIAYLYALKQVIEQEKCLQRPWLDRALLWDSKKIQPSSPPSPSSSSSSPLPPPHSPLPTPSIKLQGLLNTLRPGKLSDTQAEQALSSLTDSLLVQQMSNAVKAWFIANGTEETEAKLLTQRIGYSLSGHLITVIAENAAPLAQLRKFLKVGNSLNAASSGGISSGSDKNLDITSNIPGFFGEKIYLSRELYRAKLLKALSEPLLGEMFALKDIYVPLQGLLVEENIYDSNKKNIEPIDLMTWTQQQLDDSETIAVIESEPGYGKTSFCQVLAAQVAKELYPAWIPIFIRLRDITWGNTLIKTLDSAFQDGRSNICDWLETEHPRCLLILDGFDELPPCLQGKMTKAIFFNQLQRLQSQCRHKIVLTSRTQALQDIIQQWPWQLRRISILPFDKEELKQWFQLWAKVLSLPIAQNFFNFLKQEGLFSTKYKLSEFAVKIRQPLMLYLLGVLHRDGLLNAAFLSELEKNEHNSSAFVNWEIYYCLSRWLLGYPLTDSVQTILQPSGSSHIHRTKESISNLLAGTHPQDLLEQMHDFALQLIHSQRYRLGNWEWGIGSRELGVGSSVKQIPLPAFYFKSQQSTVNHQQSSVNRQQSTVNRQQSIEFSHSKLGEFLCAEAIVVKLKLLTQCQSSLMGESNYVLDSSSRVAQYLYNLFGFGVLTLEIEELILQGLIREQKREFSLEVLCNRMLPFWYDYCRGRWLDEGITHKAVTYFQSLQNPVNVEQVNAAVGINVFLLLCAVHREANISFSPCGNSASLLDFQPQALSILIGRTTVLYKNAFNERICAKSLAGLNLTGAYLPQLMLAGANLTQTNFTAADLIGANFAGANLAAANFADANLVGVNFVGANLAGANLGGANLTGANLTGVYLHSVNLSNCCLFAAIMSETDKEMALLNGAMFSLEQFHSLKQLLSQESGVSTGHHTDSTAAWLSSASGTPGVGHIESVEGEPILSMDLYESFPEDETVLGANDYEDE